MAERKKFNFGSIDRAFTANGSDEVQETVNGTAATVSAEAVEQKPVVTELLDKIERPGDVRRAFDVRFIPRSKIEFHKKNDYPMEAVESLADSILEFGLISNLEVYYNEETDRYILESGEQRTRAIDLLIKKYETATDTESVEYKNYLENVRQFAVEGYPCNVKRRRQREGVADDKATLLDEIESETRLIIANESGRERNVERTRKHIQRLNYLYTERNKLLKKEEKSNVNAEIGQQLGITERQVQKYKAVDRLIPELQDLFAQKGITLTEGASYAKLDEKDQRQLLALFEAGEDKKEVNALYAKMSRLQAEIDVSKKEIQELEAQKQDALEKVAAEQRTAEQMAEKIRAELKKEEEEKGASDKKLIMQLQNQLEIANQNIVEHQKQRTELEQTQAKKVAELEEKLAAKENKQSAGPLPAVRIALQIEEKLKNVSNILKELQETLTAYDQIYDASSGEKSPEKYKAELMAIWQTEK